MKMKKICLTIVVIALLLAGLLLNNTALAASTSYTSNEAYSRILKLKEQGRIPAYVVEKGKYKYIEGTRAARVKGANVNMRSQPKIESRRITRFNVNTELEYLGEWTHPKNGERWVCVRKNASSEVGWIFGKYIEYVKDNNSAQRNQASNSNNLAKPLSDTKTGEISDDKHDYNINWGYVVWGIIILCVAYVITSNVLEWEFSIVNFFEFLIYAIFTIAVGYVVCVIGYAILEFVWYKIIIPILVGLFLLVCFIGSCISCSKTECPFYPQHNCVQCKTCPYG